MRLFCKIYCKLLSSTFFCRSEITLYKNVGIFTPILPAFSNMERASFRINQIHTTAPNNVFTLIFTSSKQGHITCPCLFFFIFPRLPPPPLSQVGVLPTVLPRSACCRSRRKQIRTGGLSIIFPVECILPHHGFCQ